MEMQIFYVPDLEDQSEIQLDEDESKHAVKVLRLKAGDLIRMVNGRGKMATGTIMNPDPKKCMVKIESSETNFGKRNYYLHVAIAPTKNTDRIESFVEKSVELGIDDISFIVCENSERNRLRTDRLEKIAISAMKQSLKAYKTNIHEPVSFNEFIGSCTRPGLIAHCRGGQRKELMDVYQMGQDACIMIGPEGDFSDEEVELARNAGFREISLGNSRLRTETAGMIVCSAVYLVNTLGQE